MTKLNLKDSGSRDDFAAYLVRYEIEPSVKAQGTLPERRAKNYAIWRNEPGCSGQQNIAPNYKPFHCPLVQPRVDAIAGALYQRFTSMAPIVQCNGLGNTTIEMSNAMEMFVQAVFTRADIDIHLPLAVQTAAVCGVAVPRLYPDKEKGLCMETLHPDDTMAYPSTSRSVKECKTFGHKFYLRVEEIESRIKDGEYFDAGSLVGQSVPSTERAGSPLVPRAQPDEGVVQGKDQPVECWELHSRRDVGDGMKLYRIVVTKRNPKLLAMDELEYSRPWYFEGRLHTEWGGFYPEGCIAQNLQGMQHLFTDLNNALVAGSYAAMSPRTIVSGGSMGEKWMTMGFGDIYQSPTPVNVTVIPSGFNPGVLPQMIQEVKGEADSIARVSRISQNQQLKGRTTAAEATMVQSQGDDAQVQYAAHFARCLKEMAEFIQEFAKSHLQYVQERYPEAPIDEEIVNGTYMMEVSGRTSGNLPSAQAEKLQTAMIVATQVNQAWLAYQQEPVYDEEQIGDAIMQTLQLPVATEKLKYPKQPQPQEQPNGNEPGIMGGPPPGMAQDMGFNGMGMPPESFGDFQGNGAGQPPFDVSQFAG